MCDVVSPTGPLFNGLCSFYGWVDSWTMHSVVPEEEEVGLRGHQPTWVDNSVGDSTLFPQSLSNNRQIWYVPSLDLRADFIFASPWIYRFLEFREKIHEFRGKILEFNVKFFSLGRQQLREIRFSPQIFITFCQIFELSRKSLFFRKKYLEFRSPCFAKIG